jgi:tyrosyl-tRNA synthetase
MTTPLATRPDGTKFGKSVSGALWLDPKRTSPYLLYQFLVNTADAVVDDYLCYFTFLDRDEIIELREDTAGHPERRSAQRRLAHEVCTMVHGADETARAERASQALFGEEIASLDESTLLAVVDDAPSSAISRASLVDGLSVVDALVASELAKSKAEARRLIGSNSVCVNNRLVDGDDRRLGVADLLHDRYIVLRKGRRSFHLLRVE